MKPITITLTDRQETSILRRITEMTARGWSQISNVHPQRINGPHDSYTRYLVKMEKAVLK